MVKTSAVIIKSKNNISIANSYFKNDAKAKTLVVVFPGMGYSCANPLLYYSTDAALGAGFDALNLRYFFQCATAELDQKQVVDDCLSAINMCLSYPETDYENIIFLSKSIGTVFAGETARLLENTKVHQVFLTPIAATIPYIKENPCTIIVGGKDSLFSKDNIDAVKKLALSRLHVLNGADHSLEVPGNCIESIAVLSDVIKIWIEFLKGYNVKS